MFISELRVCYTNSILRRTTDILSERARMAVVPRSNEFSSIYNVHVVNCLASCTKILFLCNIVSAEHTRHLWRKWQTHALTCTWMYKSRQRIARFLRVRKRRRKKPPKRKKGECSKLKSNIRHERRGHEKIYFIV